MQYRIYYSRSAEPSEAWIIQEMPEKKTVAAVADVVFSGVTGWLTEPIANEQPGAVLIIDNAVLSVMSLNNGKKRAGLRPL